jgi:hypothetical protein
MESSDPNLKYPVGPAASPLPFDDSEGPWWFPGWWEVAKLLGWRWIFAMPLLGLLGILLLAVVDLRYINFFIIIGFKAIIFLVAAPIAVLASMMRSAVQMRKDPFCIHCGYGLEGLPDHYKCPECGRNYSLALVHEYRRNPHWFIERAKSARSLPVTHAPFAAGPVASPRSGDGT